MKAYHATFYFGVPVALTAAVVETALKTVFTDGATITQATGIWQGGVEPSYVVNAIARLENLGSPIFTAETDAQVQNLAEHTAKKLGEIFGQDEVWFNWERGENFTAVDSSLPDEAKEPNVDGMPPGLVALLESLKQDGIEAPDLDEADDASPSIR